MTKLEFLEEQKEIICHNIFCYSSNFLMTKPKDHFVKEWKHENKKLAIVDEMISKEKKKLHRNRAGNEKGGHIWK